MGKVAVLWCISILLFSPNLWSITSLTMWWSSLGVYYNNVWSAKKFPFLSQLLFSEQSNGSSYITFNQTAILDASNRVDPVLLAEQGLPFYAATYATSILTTNMALTATFVHMLLWCYGDISPGWAFINRKNLQMLMKPSTWKWKFWQTDDEDYKRAKLADPNTDPHYKREWQLYFPDLFLLLWLSFKPLGVKPSFVEIEPQTKPITKLRREWTILIISL